MDSSFYKQFEEYQERERKRRLNLNPEYKKKITKKLVRSWIRSRLAEEINMKNSDRYTKTAVTKTRRTFSNELDKVFGKIEDLRIRIIRNVPIRNYLEEKYTTDEKLDKLVKAKISKLKQVS